MYFCNVFFFENTFVKTICKLFERMLVSVCNKPAIPDNKNSNVFDELFCSANQLRHPGKEDVRGDHMFWVS